MFRKIEENLSTSNTQPLKTATRFRLWRERKKTEHNKPRPSVSTSARPSPSSPASTPPPEAAAAQDAILPTSRQEREKLDAPHYHYQQRLIIILHLKFKIYLGMATIYIIHLLQTNCCANAHYIAQSVCNILYQILSILQPRMSPSSFTTVLPTARVH